MSAVLNNIECRMGELPHLDRTGDDPRDLDHERASNVTLLAQRAVMAIPKVERDERVAMLLVDLIERFIANSNWAKTEHGSQVSDLLSDAVFLLENVADAKSMES